MSRTEEQVLFSPPVDYPQGILGLVIISFLHNEHGLRCCKYKGNTYEMVSGRRSAQMIAAYIG